MEHGRERTEFGGARRAENGVNMFYESAETMGGALCEYFAKSMIYLRFKVFFSKILTVLSC